MLLVCANIALAQKPASPKPGSSQPGVGGGQFRVCADPQNMPHSNDKLEGFENKIADLVARQLGETTRYIWWGSGAVSFATR